MGFPVTINGTTYNASDFAPYGYVDNFPRMMQDMAATAATTAAQAQRLIGTSNSSVSIGTGSKSFTTQAGKLFDAGGHLLITADGAPSTNFMLGRVTSYSGASLTVDVVLIGETVSGTYSAWTIRVTGYQGPQGVTGFTGASTPGADQFETRAAVAGATIASTGSGGPGYIRTAGYSAAGDGGHGLYKRVGSLPSHSAYVQSTDGAYWELVPENGQVNILQVGGKGDFNGTTGTDNLVAFQAARSLIIAKRGLVNGSFDLFVPGGTYYSSSYWEIKGACFNIRGVGNGTSGGKATILRWPAGTHGIIVAASDTLGAGAENPSTGPGGDGAIISNLLLWSLAQSTHTWHHGIWLRARATIREVQVASFPFAGIYIRASAGGSVNDPTNFDHGNANCWHMDNVSSYYNMFGVYACGADANAGYCIGGDFSHNECWGLFDATFLGCSWFGIHTTNNGNFGEAATYRCQCHHNGKLWVVTAFHTDSASLPRTSASTTEPGTNGDVWTQIGVQASPDSNYPAWVSGTQTWQQAGSYCTLDVNNFSVLSGIYSEGGQPPMQFNGRTDVHGGAFGSLINYASLRHVYADNTFYGGFLTKTLHDDGKFTTMRLGGSGTSVNNVLSLSHDTALPGGLSWQYDATSHDYVWVYAGGSFVGSLTSANTTTTADRGAPIPLSWMFPRLFFSGDHGGWRRMATTGPDAPSDGNWATGDIAYNLYPGSDHSFASKGMVGFVCVNAGSPGTWMPFGEYGVYKEWATNIDLPSVAAGATTVLGTTITITGAATGDFVEIIPKGDLQGLQVTGYVSSTNTISIRITNPTSGAIDLSYTNFLAVLRKWPA
jgi:hypothetical protein